MDGDLVYCNNIQGLMEGLYVEYKLEKWRVTDPSKISLKAILLCNGNVKHSILNAHAVRMKETYLYLKYIAKNTLWRSLVEHMG